jgi:hypothetical protein
MKQIRLSTLKAFDADRYRPDSPWWQFCILLRNLEDPRFAAGVDIFCLLFSLIIFAGFVGGVVITPLQCPAQTEDADSVG